MHVTFVSDAHLAGPDDPAQAQFLAFLEELRTDLLVLGGDVFQHWWHFGAAPFPAYEAVVHAIERFPRVVLPGNHDFYAPAFFEARGALPAHGGAYECVDRGRRIHLHHGDHADTSWGYAATRTLLRGGLFRRYVDGLGPDRAWHFLGSLVHGGVRENLPLIEAQAALAARIGANREAQVVVFGHTHAPRTVVGSTVYLNAGAFPATWVEIEDGVPRLCGPGRTARSSPLPGGPSLG